MRHKTWDTRHRTIHVLMLAFLCLVTGCEKDFDMSPGPSATRLVVNCELDAGQPVKLFLSESSSPNNRSTLTAVRDATVEMYRNDSLVSVLPFVFSDTGLTFGSYRHPDPVLPGSRYSFIIRHPSYATVTASDSVPAAPVVTSYELLHYGDHTDNYASSFRFRLSDDAASDDFYRVSIWVWGRFIYSIDSTGDSTLRDFASFVSPDFSESLSDTVRQYGYSLLFSDQTFNGQNKELNFHFTALDLSRSTSANLVVEVSRISKANYVYYKTLEQFRHSSPDADVPPVFSNIAGGYGILMSRAYYQMAVPIK